MAVVGGTGVLGAPLVAALAAKGDDVLALSRRPSTKLPEGASHRQVDLTSGDGLAGALAGVEVVVDAADSTAKPGEVLAEGTRRLLRAGAEAGIRHHVGVSIVGCDRVPLAYYEVKLEQEAAIAGGEVPWSLLRATQFHTLIAWACGRAARFGVVPSGSARLQPIHPPVVAARLAEVAHAEPAGRLADIAGPEVVTLTKLAKAWRSAGHKALPLRVPMIGSIGRPLREGALTNPAAAAGGPTFAKWLADD